MALLLAIYQKMRLIREKNQATLDLTKYTSKVNRVEKNIARVQKMYTSRMAQLDSQAKMMMSRAKTTFQQNLGLNMNMGSPYLNPYQAGGSNAYVNQQIQRYMNSGIPYTLNDEGKFDQITDQEALKNGKDFYQIDPDYRDTLVELYMRGQLNSGKAIEDDDENLDFNGTTIPKAQIAAFNMIANKANQDYYMANNMLTQSTSNYEQNVSIWLEAAKAQLEEEQDAALEPLNYQQTMWELEKELAEQRLTRIKEELESYKKLCDEEARDQAPKFGLG